MFFRGDFISIFIAVLVLEWDDCQGGCRGVRPSLHRGRLLTPRGQNGPEWVGLSFITVVPWLPVRDFVCSVLIKRKKKYAGRFSVWIFRQLPKYSTIITVGLKKKTTSLQVCFRKCFICQGYIIHLFHSRKTLTTNYLTAGQLCVDFLWSHPFSSSCIKI